MWIRSEDGFLVNMDHIVSVAVDQPATIAGYQLVAYVDETDKSEDAIGPNYFVIATFETKAAAECLLDQLWERVKPLNVFDMYDAGHDR